MFLQNKWGPDKLAAQRAELDAFFERTGYPRVPRNYLIKWLTDWVRTCGIDGFRIDTARHVERDAWQDLKAEAVRALRAWKAESRYNSGRQGNGRRAGGSARFKT